MAQAKPIIILSSRSITQKEMIQFHKFLNTLVFDNNYHKDKQASKLPYDCLIIDLRNSENREYWSIQAKDFLPTDNIVWLRSAADEQTESKLDNFTYKHSTKKIKLDAVDKLSFINSLQSLHVGSVIGYKKKILHYLLSCFGKLH